MDKQRKSEWLLVFMAVYMAGICAFGSILDEALFRGVIAYWVVAYVVFYFFRIEKKQERRA